MALELARSRRNVEGRESCRLCANTCRRDGRCSDATRRGNRLNHSRIGVLLQKVLKLFALIAPLTTFAACGDSSTYPPNPPANSVASVTILSAPPSLEAGSTLRLVALVRDAQGESLTRVPEWTSSNPAVASVTSDGVVFGIAPGTTVISASVEGMIGSVTLSISPRPPVAAAAVVINAPRTDVEIGAALQLTAVVKDSAGNALSGRSVAWSSTNALVAAVDTNGRVTAISAGTTRIAATSEGITGSITLTVLPQAGIDISISTPVLAKQFVIAIDGGALAQTQLFYALPDSSTGGRLAVTLPAGGPYRVRALAIDASATGTSSTGTLLVGATGKSTGVMVSAGSRAAVTVNLVRPTVQISAPAQASYYSDVTVTWTYTDAGDVLESDDHAGNKPVGYLNYSSSPFIDGSTSAAIAVASATKVSSGVYQFTATFTAPYSAGPVYFQTQAVAFSVPFATGSNMLGGFLLSPSTARGETLGVISIQ